VVLLGELSWYLADSGFWHLPDSASGLVVSCQSRSLRVRARDDDCFSSFPDFPFFGIEWLYLLFSVSSMLFNHVQSLASNVGCEDCKVMITHFIPKSTSALFKLNYWYNDKQIPQLPRCPTPTLDSDRHSSKLKKDEGSQVKLRNNEGREFKHSVIKASSKYRDSHSVNRDLVFQHICFPSPLL
jgi:hypothetical protein